MKGSDYSDYFLNYFNYLRRMSEANRNVPRDISLDRLLKHNLNSLHVQSVKIAKIDNKNKMLVN